MVNTKDKLIDAAIALFERKGYRGTTVGEIEARTGLSARAGGFYRHFKSKEQLLLEIFDRVVETPKSLALSSLMPLGDARAELLLIARSYIGLNKGKERLTALLLNEAERVPALKKKLQHANETLFEELKNWVSKKPAAEGMDDEALSALTLTIFGGLLYYLIRKDKIGKLRKLEEPFLDFWATYWARALASPAPLP